MKKKTPYEFLLDGHEYIELNQLLKVVGLVNSGGEANAFISNGEVRVNDTIETRKRNKIKTGFKVEFDGQILLVK
ncbi:MAG: RNA-binding S4 domain-containing protein [Saprospiraceae bacterium]|nr:RNA-binding S4 domain-containing protein [Saprospiraceae bacterium]